MNINLLETADLLKEYSFKSYIGEGIQFDRGTLSLTDASWHDKEIETGLAPPDPCGDFIYSSWLRVGTLIAHLRDRDIVFARLSGLFTICK